MRRGTPRDLEIALRYGQISAQYSIQDVYDLLVELITNSDDSYRHLHDQGLLESDRGPILISVERHRGSQRSVIVVSDRAAGIDDLDRAVARIGDRTSFDGDRGFMARGLKDCAALGNVTIDSIKDGRYRKAEVTSDFKYVPYDSGRRPSAPSAETRTELGIPKNGTRVSVELASAVRMPQRQTLVRELPWHFALRRIFVDGKVRIRVGEEPPETVIQYPPAGETVHDEEFEVPGYKGIRGRFTLVRSDKPLEDPVDKRFRRSGILISGSRATHACSFLTPELEQDPASDRFFGSLSSDGIDRLAREWDDRRARGEQHPADNPILIFDPNRRNGLQQNHPFTKALFSVAIEVLKVHFEKERSDRRRHEQAVESRETADRLRRLAREASQFMRDKLEDVESISPTDVVNERSWVEKGISLVPAYTQIQLGKEKRFFVRVHSRLGLPVGTEVSVHLSKAASAALELVGEPSELELDPRQDGVLRGSFVLRGKRESGRVQVSCKVDGLEDVYTEVEVLPAGSADVDVPGDFSFHRARYTVRMGSRRSLKLRARFNPPPEEAPSVSFRFDAPEVVVLRRQGPLELVPGTTYYEAELVVEGRTLNAETKVVAEGPNEARAETVVVVVSREDEGVDLQFKLVPYPLGRASRAVWDRKQPNLLNITTQHESVSRYLGAADDGFPGQNDPPFRVLLAELIADNVCRRIVEETMRVLPGETDAFGVYFQHNRLMNEFTPIAHRIMLSDPRG